jgi:hypothetical protein
MDIHAPDRPVHSFRDFATHIAIVTVGILIALGLDGLRESVREHRLVRETRSNIQLEMLSNQQHAAQEFSRIVQGRDQLKALLSGWQVLAHQHPEQGAAQVDRVQNPYYFFSANSWQAALSTGALAHMSTDEASAYAGAAESIRIYTGLQTQTMNQEMRTVAFFTAHPHPTQDQIEQATEDLILFYGDEKSLAFVCPQMQAEIDRALRASAPR